MQAKETDSGLHWKLLRRLSPRVRYFRHPWVHRTGDNQNGFTLVEVLVALAVLTIALAAVMRALSQGIDTSSSLRDRALAMWVAQNRLVTHQIQKDWPGLDTTEGTADMAGREWRWREQVLAAPGEADLRQIHIEVRAAGDTQTLARLIGFLPKP